MQNSFRFSFSSHRISNFSIHFHSCSGFPPRIAFACSVGARESFTSHAMKLGGISSMVVARRTFCLFQFTNCLVACLRSIHRTHFLQSTKPGKKKRDGIDFCTFLVRSPANKLYNSLVHIVCVLGDYCLLMKSTLSSSVSCIARRHLFIGRFFN